MRDLELAGLARTLSQDHGITVTVSGEHSYCCLQTKKINIARMPATALGKQLMCGLVYHEVGHKKYTTGGRPEGFAGELTNVIEDIRVEQLTLQARPGTRYDLQAVTDYYLAHSPLDPDNLPQALLGWVMAYGRAYVLKQKKILTQITPCVDYLKKRFDQTLVDRLEALLLAQLPRLQSTKESSDLTEAILALVRNHVVYRHNDSHQQSPEDADSLATPGCQNSSRETEEQHHCSEFCPEDDNDLLVNKQEFSADENDTLFAGETAGVGNIRAFLTAELDSLASQTSYSESMAIPEYPEISYGFKAEYEIDATAALNASARMRNKLPALLQTIKQCPVSFGYSGKKIDSGRLDLLAVGDPRIFKRKQTISALDTAVMILLDRSGSMAAQTEGHSLSEVANLSAFALHHCLSRIPDIAVASVAFTDSMDDQPELQMLCDFKQKPDHHAYALNPAGGTPIHTALWYARAALLQRLETRKVVLLLTDGEPNCPNSTRVATQQCQKNSIEIIALGILTDAVKKYWSRSMVIDQLVDLPATMFQVMGDYWQGSRG